MAATSSVVPIRTAESNRASLWWAVPRSPNAAVSMLTPAEETAAEH
ncbi:hypothetical protein ACFW2D_16420 [Streptomyces sp. NPDC058914]